MNAQKAAILVGLIFMTSLMIYLGSLYGPNLENQDEVVGSIAAGLGLILGSVTTWFVSHVFSERDTAKSAAESEAVKYRDIIGGAIDDLIPCTARLSTRVKLAGGADHNGQLVAARDNVQQLTQIILKLSHHCDREMEDVRSKIQKAQDEIDDTATVLNSGVKMVANLADIGSEVNKTEATVLKQIETSGLHVDDDVLLMIKSSFDDIQDSLSDRLDDIEDAIAAGTTGTEYNESNDLIETVPPSTPSDNHSAETVKCPYCDVDTEVVLGKHAGDSAHGYCPNNHTFHAHRDSNDGVFTRKKGKRKFDRNLPSWTDMQSAPFSNVFKS